MNYELRRELDSYVNKPAALRYHEEDRVGYIKAVKQGPCRKTKSGEFEYLNYPDGALYIEWCSWTDERGYAEPKTMKWERVSNFELINTVAKATDVKPREPRSEATFVTRPGGLIIIKEVI